MISSHVSVNTAVGLSSAAFAAQGGYSPITGKAPVVSNVPESTKPLEALSASASVRLYSNTTAVPDAGQSPAVEGSPTAAFDSGSDTFEKDAKQRQQVDAKIEQQQLAQERQQVAELAARDREVRTHEQAHAAAGGQYAGAPQYDYRRGPDGVNYAVGGEVSIDTRAAVTPEQTIEKAQIIRKAALAPAEPSSQDRKVAAQATQMETAARAEMASENADAARDSGSIDRASPTRGEAVVSAPSTD